MASIADVYVTVLPETGKIADGIKKALRDVDDDVRKAAKRWKKEIEEALGGLDLDIDTKKAERKIDEVEKKKPTVTVDVEVDDSDIEKKVTKRKRKPKVPVEAELDEKSVADLEKQADALFKRLDVDLDEQVMRNQLKKLQGDVEKSLSQVGIKLNERSVNHQLTQLRSELERLFGADNPISMDFNPARGLGSLRALFGDFSGNLTEGLMNAWEDAAEKIKKVEVDVDVKTKTAERRINALKRKAEKLFDQMGIDVDTDIAYAEIASLRGQAGQILSDLELGLDTSDAYTELLALEALIKAKNPTLTVDVDYDRDTLERTAAQVSGILASGAVQTGAEVGKTIFGFAGETLEKLARVHPILTVAAVSSIIGIGAELAGVAASLTGIIGMIPAVGVAAVAAFSTAKLAAGDFMKVMEDMADPDKFSVGLRTLGPEAQQAALSIKSIMDSAITPLKAALSEELFAGIGPALINTVNAILPVIQPGLVAIAGAFNSMVTGVMQVFQNPEMISLVNQLMTNIGTAFQLAAPALGLFVDALVRMAAAGSDFLPGFAEGLANVALKFSDFITRVTESGDFNEWIQLAIDTMRELWPLIPAVVDAFMGLIPLAQAVLPDMVAALSSLLEVIPELSFVLALMAGNWFALAASIETTRAICEFIGDTITVLGGILDGLMGKPGAVQSAFQTAFPGMSGAVSAAATIIEAAVQRISQAIDAVISKISGFANNPVVRFLAPGLSAGLSTVVPGPGVSSAQISAPRPGFPTAPDDRGMIPGTNLPWTSQTPIGQTGSLPIGPAGPPTADTSPRRQPARAPGGGPVASSVPNPLVPGAPPGGIPLPPLPPPKAGGGGGGGGGAKPEPVSPVPGAGYTYGGFGELNWEALAEKESGGNWSMNTGNGYYGGLQFDLPTWNEFGGQQFAERPDLASKADQIKVATALYNKRNIAPWPANGWLLTASEDQLRSAGLTASGNTRRGGPAGPAGSYGGGSYGGGSYGGGRRSSYVPNDSGLKPNAARANDLIAQQFPGITNIGGYRANGMGSNAHPSGHALDIMIPGWDTAEGKGMGDAVNQWLQQNAAALGLKATIWQDFWQPVEGQGHLLGRMNQGPDAAHLTHVHGEFGDQAPVGNLTDYYDGTYMGPGQNRNDPMYVQSAESGGAQFGKDLVSGIMDIFGFGDLFKDPTQFGAFKAFKGLAQYGTGLAKSQQQDNGYYNGSGGGGDPFGFGGGGGGGTGLPDLLLNMVKPFGALGSGSPENAPGEFIPGITAGATGSLPDFMAGLVPPGQPQQPQVVDNSFHATIGDTKADTTDVMSAFDDRYLQHTRTGLRNTP